MIVENGVIEYFEKQNIHIKNHPLSKEEWSKKVWNDQYNYHYNYHKDAHLGFDSNGNSIHPSHEKLDQDAKNYADRYTPSKINDWYNSDTLFIEYEHNGNQRLICKKISIKSKRITPKFIEDLITKDIKQYNGIFGKFADAMNKLIVILGYNVNSCVYPTTYGIGVWIFYNWNAQESISKIESILKQNNIEYKTEYSDARFVYRFKISKKQANIKLVLNT